MTASLCGHSVARIVILRPHYAPQDALFCQTLSFNFPTMRSTVRCVEPQRITEPSFLQRLEPYPMVGAKTRISSNFNKAQIDPNPVWNHPRPSGPLLIYQYVLNYNTNLVEASNHVKKCRNYKSRLKSNYEFMNFPKSIIYAETYQINPEWLQSLHMSNIWHNGPVSISWIKIWPRYQQNQPSANL